MFRPHRAGQADFPHPALGGCFPVCFMSRNSKPLGSGISPVRNPCVVDRHERAAAMQLLPPEVRKKHFCYRGAILSGKWGFVLE
jgi:hypothetical protein